jgi:DNA-directed RNA polymerase specialized sigma24 family protein
MTKKKIKKKNKISTNKKVTEQEFLEVLDNISKRLVHKFRFGYHDIDDMKQQAAIFALEGLEKYDNSRPLENFLWTHVRNRLFNYKRNNYQRPDKPCATCPLYDPDLKISSNQCAKYSNKQDCEPYSAWSQRNESKKNIMQPSYIEYDMEHSNNLDLLIQNNEIINFLDANIHADYRESYLRLKHGEKITKNKIIKLQKHIQELIESTQWAQKFPKNEDN